MISNEYAIKFSEAAKKKPLMQSYFIRIYHMKDGSKIEMSNSRFQTRELAHQGLWGFHPTHEEGADDMANVAYITIEERYTPTPFWD